LRIAIACRLLLIPLVAVGAAATYALAAEQRPAADAVLADWRKSVAAFIGATDPEAALSVYMAIHTPDAVLMFPGRPALTGTEEIRPYIQEFCKAYRFDLPDLQTDDLVVKGDLAIHRYSGTAVLIPRGGGESRHTARKYVDVLRLGRDGRWKVALHIFNTNQ